MTIEQLYLLFKHCSEVTTDTRNCPKNSLFIALKGANFNGNKFAQKAVANGCAYAIVDEPAYADGKQIFSSDYSGVETLQRLANYHRQQFNIPVIGITGTNGKTTTKELIATVLQKKYSVLYTEGNLNNHIGVPLTLLRLKESHAIAIIEMGANHPKEIGELCHIAEPTMGIITNIGKAHLEGFGSIEGVLYTKGELYKYIEEKQGALFVQSENELLKRILPQVTTFRYGKTKKNDIQGEVISSSSPFLAIRWRSKESDWQSLQTHLIGNYNLDNLLAAVTIGRYFKVEDKAIIEALEAYIPTNNRSQFIVKGSNKVIIDAYNANPNSMQVALENFEALLLPNKILILGDMKELGEQSAEEHQLIVKMAEQIVCDELFLIGSCFMKTESDKAVKFESTQAFIGWLKTHPMTEKLFLIKGSRTMQLEQLVDLLGA